MEKQDEPDEDHPHRERNAENADQQADIAPRQTEVSLGREGRRIARGRGDGGADGVEPFGDERVFGGGQADPAFHRRQQELFTLSIFLPGHADEVTTNW